MSHDFLCCANCSHVTRHSGSIVVPVSAGTIAPSVDGRLPKHTAAYLAKGIAHCNNCGLSAPNLEDDAEIHPDLLRHPDYLALIHDADLAAAPRHYLAHAWLNHAQSRHDVAFESALCAAWYCDDFLGTMAEQADYCRRAAMGYMNAQHERAEKHVRSRDEDLLLHINLLRRIGDMEEALHFARTAMSFKGLLVDTHRKLTVEYALILGGNRGPNLLADQEQYKPAPLPKDSPWDTSSAPADKLPEPRDGDRPFFHFSGAELLRYAQQHHEALPSLIDIAKETQHRRKVPQVLRIFVGAALLRLL